MQQAFTFQVISGNLCTHFVVAPYMSTDTADLQAVGIREFRSRLADYVLHSREPIAVTRHGSTIGFFVPASPHGDSNVSASLVDLATQVDRMLQDASFTESDLTAAIKDFRAWKKKGRRVPR